MWRTAFFELKRLELARALAVKPKLLLLDELAAGLDETALEKLLKVVKEINNDGVTIILIEHDMSVIMKTVNKLMVLHKGKKIAEGAPLQVLGSKIVSDIYLGGG